MTWRSTAKPPITARTESETPPMAQANPPDAATLRRAVIASVIGNGLEWFDFLIYGFFAAVIADVFFPARNPELSLILTFATFGVGFVVRPFGGILIGIYADHAGRQKALSMLIAVMAIGTVMLGITPSYAAIGIPAPILVVAARVLQGLSVGGEFASSTALLVEYAPAGRRHYFGAFQMVAQSFAVALAAGMAFLLTTLLSPPALNAWGWRVPFLLGGLVGPAGFYIRRRVADAPEFLEARRQAKARAERAPLALVLAEYRGPLLCAIGTIVCGTAATYLWNSYLPVYVVRTLHLPLAAPLAGIAVCGVINMVVNPAAGALADRIGPYRVFFPAVIAAALLTYPLFAFVLAHPSRLNLFFVQVIATLILGCIAGPIPGLLGSFFPPRVRSTGLSISYNLSVTLFGGLAPLTVTWLSGLTASRFVPAFYLVASALLSLILVAGFRPRPQREVIAVISPQASD